mgnify:FL=1
MFRGLARWGASARWGQALNASAVFDETPAQSMWRHPATTETGQPIWPDDPDEVPAWRIEREAWALSIGVTLPSYRTKREWMQAEDLATMSCSPLIVTQIAPEESIEDVARAFLAHLRERNEGPMSAKRVTEVYSDWCEDTARAPRSVDQVKAVVALLPGVARSMADQRVNNRRRRVVMWDFDAPYHQEAEDLRMAA